MTSQVRRIGGCHLLLRGNRWMPISVDKTLRAKDRCSPGGAVISAYLSAVVEGNAIVGWLRNSAFSVQEVLPNGTLAPLDLTPARLAWQAYDADMEASKAGNNWRKCADCGASDSGTKYWKPSFEVTRGCTRTCYGTDTRQNSGPSCCRRASVRLLKRENLWGRASMSALPEHFRHQLVPLLPTRRRPQCRDTGPCFRSLYARARAAQPSDCLSVDRSGSPWCVAVMRTK
jgi:hypothetical protein